MQTRTVTRRSAHANGFQDVNLQQPANLEAETSVLGACLVDDAAYGMAVRILRPLDFYRHAHRIVFERMGTVVERGRILDVVTLKEELARAGELETVGGPAYIASLSDGVPRATNVAHYASIVVEKRRLRDVIERSLAIVKRAHDGIVDEAAIDALKAASLGRAATSPLVSMGLEKLRAHRFEQRRAILTRDETPVLREGHLGQIHASRGVGKTWFLQTLALVAASGGSALGFRAGQPCRVLYVDGEMASEEIQDRLLLLADCLGISGEPSIEVIAADWQENFLPRVDTVDGQAALAPFVDSADLIVLDNRSCLIDPEGEKDPSAWQPTQEFLLGLRRRGKAVLLAHHSNRVGSARGHSKAEDVMNLLISLTRPDGYSQDEGASFVATFDKCRGAFGPAVAPFAAKLTPNGWCMDRAAQEAKLSASDRLLEFVRLSQAAGERVPSANRAINGARVRRNEGLVAWSEMLSSGAIARHPDGGFEAR